MAPWAIKHKHSARRAFLFGHQIVFPYFQPSLFSRHTQSLVGVKKEKAEKNLFLSIFFLGFSKLITVISITRNKDRALKYIWGSS